MTSCDTSVTSCATSVTSATPLLPLYCVRLRHTCDGSLPSMYSETKTPDTQSTAPIGSVSAMDFRRSDNSRFATRGCDGFSGGTGLLAKQMRYLATDFPTATCEIPIRYLTPWHRGRWLLNFSRRSATWHTRPGPLALIPYVKSISCGFLSHEYYFTPVPIH